MRFSMSCPRIWPLALGSAGDQSEARRARGFYKRIGGMRLRNAGRRTMSRRTRRFSQRFENVELDETMPMTRRNLIAMACCSLLLSLAPQVAGISAFAKDGRDDDDSSGSGSSGSSGGSGSSGSSGHGGDDSDDDRSGRGGGDDDDNSGPGGGHDDDDDDDNSGRGRRSDQERARDGVEKGRILALKDVLRLVDEDKYGAVIAVDLRNNGEVYRLRTRDRQGTIRNLRINARTGKFMNIFGF
ncbi:PepSY domain-containing protein [Ensifer adhaerens]|uniref:PepSY domain-containing protein n=1 Tax=Ensifer adhaerens TaxID=106592 RepID=UPI001F2BCC8B|nr:hypothetical protein [Ensifer adhaerens]